MDTFANADIICQRLLTMLPDIARMIIVNRPENENFKQNPDDPNEHVANWHQFGIITHTSFFLKSFESEAQEHFKSWNINRRIEAKLQERIDGVTKLELLKISIIFHDIGKFARNFEESNGIIEHNFYGHEALSEKLINENDFVHSLLKDTFSITEAQIKYIARCAGLHFELGKARNSARASSQGYSISFANSAQCKESCNEIATNFPEFKEEIGILFLCDNLAKTNIRIDVDNDDDILNKTQYIENILLERKLNPHLISAIKQLPVSIAIARKYLDSI